MYFSLLSESLRQLCVFKKIEKSSMAWPCQLTIGSNLSIRIVAYKSVSGRYTFFKAVLPGRLICLHKELTIHVWAIQYQDYCFCNCFPGVFHLYLAFMKTTC